MNSENNENLNPNMHPLSPLRRKTPSKINTPPNMKPLKRRVLNLNTTMSDFMKKNGMTPLTAPTRGGKKKKNKKNTRKIKSKRTKKNRKNKNKNKNKHKKTKK